MPTGFFAAISAADDGVRHDLAVDARLAHASRDQLRVLRAEVDDEDGALGGLGLLGQRVFSVGMAWAGSGLVDSAWSAQRRRTAQPPRARARYVLDLTARRAPP